MVPRLDISPETSQSPDGQAQLVSGRAVVGSAQAIELLPRQASAPVGARRWVDAPARHDGKREGGSPGRAINTLVSFFDSTFSGLYNACRKSSEQYDKSRRIVSDDRTEIPP